MTQRPARNQRGAALVTAMILVALVVTLSSAMVWQQWQAVRIEAAERARVQSAWILQGALDWSRLILREHRGGVTALTEPWAQPLPETRLATFLAADKANVEGAPEAFLSGAITDAQGRYNLTNLVDESGKPAEAELATLRRLADLVGVSASTAEHIAEGMRAALAPPADGAADGAPLLPRRLAQLAWFGVDADAIARLEPYVVLLPVRTPLNVNTAAREVLSAVLDGLDLATAERITRERQRGPYRSLDEVQRLLPGTITADARRVAVTSSFFEVRGRLRLDDWLLEETALMERRGREVVALGRERVTRHETPR